ncbi:hypothetical protein DFA_06708 [Cavenderia fasciculata]|uniref:Uncharacterized protein n=1 Tax=Cavenderia fasciculata TaxID=261658 RepID=F4Q221_CACFS|nr:uncharacterized protein DFA_06708 [Cavenderia fasciculata]EGG18041.1 hypothetical protein DFA_06708 [Cavenderia fasciculata]|eukprot:XP_004356934.1 hypothetical protein DFA_06708 [Cavenderia fasciculata]
MSLFASLSKIGSINNTNSIKQSCSSSSNNSMIISMNNGSSIQSENMNAFSKPFWGKWVKIDGLVHGGEEIYRIDLINHGLAFWCLLFPEPSLRLLLERIPV